MKWIAFCVGLLVAVGVLAFARIYSQRAEAPVPAAEPEAPARTPAEVEVEPVDVALPFAEPGAAEPVEQVEVAAAEDPAPARVARAPQPEPELIPVPEPEPAHGSRVRNSAPDEPVFVEPAIVRTHLNSKRSELEAELERVEADIARRKDLLSRPAFSRGDYKELAPGVEKLPLPERRYDGVFAEIVWKRVRTSTGDPVVRYVILPFDEHPEFYDLCAERNRLRTELRLEET